MKKVKIFLPFFFSLSFAIGQKHDYQWLFGFNNANPVPDTLYGGRTLNFNYDTPQVFVHLRQADFDADNMSYCDNNGTLLAYSNGTDIYDSRDSIMPNGDSINYGWLWLHTITRPSLRYNGLTIIQGMIALPKPDDSTQLYVIHYTLNSYYEPYYGLDFYLCDTTYYTLIDFNGNGGYGDVIKKDIKLTFGHDTLSYDMFSAVQHGNGKDWWIIHPYYYGNCYYEFLLSDTGIGLYSIQCLGPDQLYYGALGSSCFSPDGSKYFWVNAADGIRMFDFDRCTGLLSNPQVIPFPGIGFGDSMLIVAGIAISPNNRFLYVTANTLILQYDLLANDIGASVDTVGIWDGGDDPYPFAATFYLAQNGPDGKIYINSPNGTRSLHVINDPNEKGDSCLFVQRQVELNSYNILTIPNFPNYRLGPLAGSACDTVYTETDEVKIENRERILKVFPNPATDIITVDYGFTNWSAPGTVSLVMVNELGQPVYTQNLPQYSGYQKIDVSRYASGIYTAYIKRNGQVIAVQKFAKE